MLIEQRPFDDSELAALVVDQQVELRVRDGGSETQVTRADPAARYLVAVLGGDAVACGGIQSLDIDTAELRRMYVRPAYRGRGIAKRMLAALEEFAVSRGHAVLRLEAGVHFLEAIALYLSAGYRPIPRFGRYLRSEYSRCFEKRLDGSERAIRLVRAPLGEPAVVELTEAAVGEAGERFASFVAAVAAEARPAVPAAAESAAAAAAGPVVPPAEPMGSVQSALPPGAPAEGGGLALPLAPISAALSGAEPAGSVFSADPAPPAKPAPGDSAGRFVLPPVDSAARFVVALIDGEPVGCAAIQPADDQTVELKRMYVRPEHRGNGVARRMLVALEDLAVGSHYRVVRLEAGVWQPEAIRLYESSDYRPIPAYGPYAGNPYSRCYEKSVIAAEPIASEST